MFLDWPPFYGTFGNVSGGSKGLHFLQLQPLVLSVGPGSGCIAIPWGVLATSKNLRKNQLFLGEFLEIN